MATAAGCSTVVFQESAPRAAFERDALVRAAGEVSKTPWPKPQNASFGAMLTGAVAGSGDRITETDAAEIYLAALGAGDQRHVSLLADADRHLSAAAALADATGTAAESLRPSKSDISTVEAAISDLRGVRDMYQLCLKRLAKDGEDIDPDALRTLRAAFNDAIEEVGDAADALADAVAEDRTETFASPASKRASFTGSL